VQPVRVFIGAVLVLATTTASWPQSTGATFGSVVNLGGTPSDIVLDESRSLLYLVSKSKNRVDIYSYDGNSIASIPVGNTPLAAAMAMDGSRLYVTNNADSTLSVINLNTRSVESTVALSAAPEGVETGPDGRVLISTEGSGSSDSVNSLLLYDPTLVGQQVTTIAFPTPATTPTGLSVSTTTSATTFTGKLIRTPDGQYIIGLSNINSNTASILFVYETASASILRARRVNGQSSVLSIAPDGSRFMAGYTLYDTATLAVIGQQNVANVPFPLSSSTTTTVSFSTRQNVGGSVFSPDGETLYGAFNVAPYSSPATRPQAATLLISNSHHLLTRLGVKIPESIVAKMVLTSDGSKAWGLSESG